MAAEIVKGKIYFSLNSSELFHQIQGGDTVDHDFSLSQQYIEAYPDVGFGLTFISSCRHVVNPAGFDAYKRKLLRKMRRRDTLAQISNRIEIYRTFSTLNPMFSSIYLCNFQDWNDRDQLLSSPRLNEGIRVNL